MQSLILVIRRLNLATVLILFAVSMHTIKAEDQAMPEYPRAAADVDIDQRLKKVEQVLQSRGLLDMLQLIEHIQQEKNRLQGEVEIQKNELALLKKRQRDLYKDIDQRLQLLEAGATKKGVQTITPTASIADGTIQNAEVIDKINEPTKTVATVQKKGATKIQMEYQRAFQLLRQAQYTQAMQEFSLFLSAYPDSDYADNAQYWLAETYYVTQRYEMALGEYEKLLALYPESPKVAHALLKIAYSYHELGNTDEARKRLADLIKKYPNTTVAHLAIDRLQQINTTNKE